MEKRKLIKFGKNSYVISLPKDWIDENNLEKGSVVSLIKNGNDLLISSESKISKYEKSITINCSDKDYILIKRLIHSSYINNFTTIIVRDFKQEYISNIRKTIKNLFAVEMIEESNNKIVIKDILNITDISLPEIIKRTDYIIRSMFEESINSFESDISEDIKERDDDVNRLSYLALKVATMSLHDNSIARVLKLNPSGILHIWELIARLENIGDSIKKISDLVKELNVNEKVNKLLIDFYKELKNDFVDVMICYYTNDEKLIYNILSNSNVRRMKIFDLNALGNEIKYSSVIEQFYTIQESIKNIARSSINTYLMK